MVAERTDLGDNGRLKLGSRRTDDLWTKRRTCRTVRSSWPQGFRSLWSSSSPPIGVGVAIRYWKRMREEAALHADDPRPDGENPWQTEAGIERPPTSDRQVSRLGDLGGIASDLRGDTGYAAEDEAAKAARYNDWAER